MINNLTDRLVKNIRVEGSVESLLGAIFEIYLRNGFVGEGIEQTNIRNIFSDPVIGLLEEYYGDNKDVMAVIEKYCYIKHVDDDTDQNDTNRSKLICSSCNIL